MRYLPFVAEDVVDLRTASWLMGYDGHVDAVEQAAVEFADALRAGPLEADVASCPGWTVADLAHHVGGFMGFYLHVLCDGTGRARPVYDDPPLGSGSPAVASWYEKLATQLVGQLRATPADTEVWTWSPWHHHAGFVARRCAHELAVHRYDAQAAHGVATPVEPDLAADGIEELLYIVEAFRELGRPGGSQPGGNGESLHLHGTDPGRDDEWLLVFERDSVRVERAHAKGTLALRGAVSDLELLLYGRPPLGEIQQFGDASVIDVWRNSYDF